MNVLIFFPAVLLSAALVVWLCVVLPWRRRQLSSETLISKIRHDRFSGMGGYLEDYTMPCSDFWAISGGLRGIRERFCEMVTLVRILQIEVSAGHVSREEAHHVWQQGLLQLWFSFWAFPEAALCRFWGKMPHACGLLALRFHYALSLSTVTLCGTNDSQISASRLYGIL